MKKQLIIGDIHGCYDELLLLLEKANYCPKTHELYFVGDLIKKGPKSLAVLKFAYNNNVKVVLGNHELGFLQFLAEERDCIACEELKQEMGAKVNFWKSYIKSWPLFIEHENFILVHAGVAPGQNLSSMGPKILCTIRTWDGQGEDLNNPAHPAWFELYKKSKTIVYGHWALRGVEVRGNSIGLDSGCCYGKQLSAVEFPSKKIIQVDALESYVSL
ncbi:MAG: hypothetical protein HOO06_13300 [Bdellovibrionaceae bacterium]|jgi:serine/threonine protein phosphatase 1|nr:hypothetical protein [Pseudobdellovibrionaceae bacterium]